MQTNCLQVQQLQGKLRLLVKGLQVKQAAVAKAKAFYASF